MYYDIICRDLFYHTVLNRITYDVTVHYTILDHIY